MKYVYSEGYVGLLIRRRVEGRATVKDGVLTLPESTKKCRGMVEGSFFVLPEDGQNFDALKEELKSVKKLVVSTGKDFWFGTNLQRLQELLPNLESVELAEGSKTIPFLSYGCFKSTGKVLNILLPNSLIDILADAKKNSAVALEEKISSAKRAFVDEMEQQYFPEDRWPEDSFRFLPADDSRHFVESKSKV